MGKKWMHAPVYYVLAQVRFNTLALLDQYVPAIQDNLRKAGYPDYAKDFLATINLSFAGGPAQSVPTLQPQARYQFLNDTKTSGFFLDQAGLTFHTTEFDTFEPFLASLIQGLSVIHSVAELSYSERIGVRYLDAICPSKNEKMSAYLAPSVLGLFDQLNDRELVHSFCETRTKQQQTTLVSRAIIQNQSIEGVTFPPEMQPVVLKLAERFSKVTGLYAVIDTDSWREDREKFDVGTIEKCLLSLHNEIRRSFDLMVTPYARKVWE